MLTSQLADVLTRIGITEEQLKGTDLLLLPENIDAGTSELQDTEESIWLGKYLKEKNVAVKTGFDLGLKPAVVERRGIDIWLGVAWVTNAIAAPVIANLIASYLLEQRQRSQDDRVHIDLRLQDGKKTSQIKYSGSLSDFERLMEGFTHSKDKKLP